MKLSIGALPLVQRIVKLVRAFRVERLIQRARTLMVVGRYESALRSFKEASRFNISFIPRDILLFSHCLSVLGKPSQAYTTSEIVEDTLLEDARRYNSDEVKYMIAYGRIIRNQAVEESEELNFPRLEVDYSSIDLDEISDDLLATFPLISHPDWEDKGWKG